MHIAPSHPVILCCTQGCSTLSTYTCVYALVIRVTRDVDGYPCIRVLVMSSVDCALILLLTKETDVQDSHHPLLTTSSIFPDQRCPWQRVQLGFLHSAYSCRILLYVKSSARSPQRVSTSRLKDSCGKEMQLGRSVKRKIGQKWRWLAINKSGTWLHSNVERFKLFTFWRQEKAKLFLPDSKSGPAAKTLSNPQKIYSAAVSDAALHHHLASQGLPNLPLVEFTLKFESPTRMNTGMLLIKQLTMTLFVFGQDFKGL